MAVVRKHMNNQIKQKHKPGCTRTSSSRMLNDEVADDSIKKQPERHLQKKGRKRMINLNSVSQVQDSSSAIERKQADSNSARNDSEMESKELSKNISDDQPLSKWSEEMHSPATNDGSRVSPPRNVEQCAEESSGTGKNYKGCS